MEDDSKSKLPQDTVSITEDEAALYDRQIRLWGLEAQQRMRNATILIMNVRGVGSETIKNIVLAGIGKIILLDSAIVNEQDLGAGFLFRPEDVGRLRVDAARPHIEALNPLVKVETVSELDVSSPVVLLPYLESKLTDVDLVCVTEMAPSQMQSINDLCRKHKKLFYAGGTYGLIGYVFCDLLEHNYLAPDKTQMVKNPSERRMVRQVETYVPFSDAIKHRWDGLSKRQTKEVNPINFFSVLSIWEYQNRHAGQLPEPTTMELDEPTDADVQASEPVVMELQSIANGLLQQARVHTQVLSTMPKDVVEHLVQTAIHEFSPVCAVVGGLLAQDILKALAGREPPYANLLVFDGVTGNGNVVRMGM